MKKLIIFIAIIIAIFALCDIKKKDVDSIIPEGQYLLYEGIREDGSKVGREEFEKDGGALDYNYIYVWKNNKATISFDSKDKKDVIIYNEYFETDDEEKAKYNYKIDSDKIEVTYPSNEKVIYMHKDKIKISDITIKEGKYLLDGDDKVNYIEVLSNKRLILNYFGNSKSLSYNSKYLFNENGYYNYKYENDKIIVEVDKKTYVYELAK